MEDSVAENDIAGRVGGNHAAMVGVGDVDSAEEFDLGIRAVIAVGVFHEPEARLLGDNDPVFVKGHSIESVESIHEGGELVGFAILVGVFEDDDSVWWGETRNGVREGGHGDRPESTASIEGDLHRVAEFGEVFLRSKDVDLEAFRDGELGHGFCDWFDDSSALAIVAFCAFGKRGERRLREVSELKVGILSDLMDHRFGEANHLMIAWHLFLILGGAGADSEVDHSVFGADNFCHSLVFGGGGGGDLV